MKLILAALIAVSTDYAMIVAGTEICAKSATVCATAQEAIRTGLWAIVPPGTPTACVARPQGCFSDRSNCIEGHNCK